MGNRKGFGIMTHYKTLSHQMHEATQEETITTVRTASNTVKFKNKNPHTLAQQLALGSTLWNPYLTSLNSD
jgi:hypothetical protein